MLKNIYQSNRNVWRGLMALLCIVCALLAPPRAYAQSESHTVAITFNGYDGSAIPKYSEMEHINLNCEGLHAVKVDGAVSSIEEIGVTFSLDGPAATGNANGGIYDILVSAPKGKGYIVIKNQIFSISLQGDRKINTITPYYGSEDLIAANQKLVDIRKGTASSGGNIGNKELNKYTTPKSTVTFNAPIDLNALTVVCLQAMVITYSGDALTGVVEPEKKPEAEMTTFTVSTSFEGVDVIKVATKDGAELSDDPEVAVGTPLTITLKAKPGYEITEVTYGGTKVGTTPNEDGSISGTIVVAKDAELSVKTVLQSFTLSTSNSAVSFVNPTTGEAISGRVEYGTEVGIKVKCPENKEVASIEVNGSNVEVLKGQSYDALVTVTGNVSVEVTYKNAETIFEIPTIEGVTIQARTKARSEVMHNTSIAIGTPLELIVTPNDGYVVNSVTYGNEPVDLEDSGNSKIGTIEVKKNASIAVATAAATASTYTLSAGETNGATVEFVDPTTGNVITGAVESGTKVGIKVTCPANKELASITCKDGDNNTISTTTGNDYCDAIIASVTSNVVVYVTLKDIMVTFTVKVPSNVTAEIKTNNGETVKSGTSIASGTILDVTLTPQVSDYINKVTYGETDITEIGKQEDGSWTGSITVAKGAQLVATTAIKTFTVSLGSHDGCDVTFVKPSTSSASEEILTMPVNYGTVVGIKVGGYDLDKQISTVTCTDNKSGESVATGAGTANCAATVTVISDVTVAVTLTEATKTNVEVSFPSVTGGSIEVSANGTALTNPSMVARGTELTITLKPTAGYAVGTLNVAGSIVGVDENNTATYKIPENASAVVISATFVKVYTVTWGSVENGTIEVKDSKGATLASGVEVKGGTSLTVTLTPSQTDMITSLSATGATVATTATKNVYTVTVTADAVLTAYIGKELKSYNLELQSAAGGSVKVWDNAERTGNTILSGSGKKVIQEGTALYGTVTVSSGYTFGSLTLGSKDITKDVDIETGNFIITMPGQAVYLTPTFNKIIPERTITVSIPEAQASMGSVSYKIGDNGSVTPYSAPFTAKQGDVITFTIKANDGYRIKTAPTLKDYTANTAKEKTGTYTVGTSNATLNVTFEEIPDRTLTVTGINLTQLPAGVAGLTATYKGNAVVFGETEVPEGAEIKFTIEADPEYEITSFSINNAAGIIAEGAGSATAIYTVPTNTAKPSVSVKYTVKHRVTNIQFELNETGISSLGTVVATYKDGSTTKTISPTASSESTSVPTNTPLTVVVTPKSGYMVESLTINNVSINISECENPTTHVVTVPDCYTTPKANAASRATADLTVDVSFKEIPVYYSLNITATGGTVPDKNNPLEVQYGTVSYSGVANLTDKVLKGTKVTITATPNTNYQIKSITINGKAQEFDITASSWSTTPPITITQNTTVAVVFEPRTYRVQVFASPTEGGDPYVGTKGTAVSSVSKGSRVTITAPANPGYKFVKWLLQGEEVKNGNALAGSTYTFTMPEADQRFTAVYETTKYTPHSVGIQIAAGQEDWGKIAIIYPRQADWTSWNSSSVFIKDWNQYVEVQAVANQEEKGRYYFDSWQISGAAAGTVTQSTAEDNLSSTINYGGNTNVTITAKFVKNYKVSVVAPVNGTVEVTTADGTMITPNHPLFVKPGTRVTVTMTSNKNYNVATLVVNDRETSRYNRPGTFSQTVTINEDTNLNALFYNPNGIEDIEADNAGTQQPEQWFTVQGRYVGTERPTQAGIYIRRCGSEAEKVVIR